MPEGYRKERPYPGTYRKLRQAAETNQMVEVWCAPCRRLVRFLAADLVLFFDPERDVMIPPFACSRCGNYERLRVTVKQPWDGDFGALDVRRPGLVRRIQTWRTVKLGDP